MGLTPRGRFSQMRFIFCSSDVIVLTNFYVSLCSEGEGVKGPKIVIALKIWPLKQLKSSTGISKGMPEIPQIQKQLEQH